jgi:hypothetical protein
MKNMTIRSVFMSVAIAAQVATGAMAQSGAEGVFTIHNDTQANIIVGFYTNDGAGWSDNWLSDILLAGESADAAFIADSGECAQLFQVGWLAEDDSEILDDPISIDICQATNVYLGDNEILFD